MPVARPTNFKQRKREPGEAPPAGINIYKLPKYRPPPAPAVRQGADDHKRFKSLGH